MAPQQVGLPTGHHQHLNLTQSGSEMEPRFALQGGEGQVQALLESYPSSTLQSSYPEENTQSSKSQDTVEASKEVIINIVVYI